MVQAVLDSERCPAVLQNAATHLERPATFEVPVCLTQGSPVTKSKPSIFRQSLEHAAAHPLRVINFASALASVVWIGWEQYKLATTVEASRHTLLATSAGLWLILLTYRLYSEDATKPSSQHGAQTSRRFANDRLPSTTLSPALCCGRVIRALENTRWPGRAEVFQDTESQATLYLDAAHTPESMKLAGEWFAECTADECDVAKPRARNILFVTVPGGVADADKLIEGVLRGSSTEKDEATGRPKLAFDRVIATSDAVRRPGGQLTLVLLDE